MTINHQLTSNRNLQKWIYNHVLNRLKQVEETLVVMAQASITMDTQI